LHEPGEDQIVAITNFVTVHVYGSLIVHTDHDWAVDAVSRLSAAFESGYNFSDVPERLREGMLKAMVAIEIRINRVEGHARMSQNRPPERIRKIIAGLRSVGNEGMASWMEGHSLPKAVEKEKVVKAAAARKRGPAQD
jgi:transcriptional regulator